MLTVKYFSASWCGPCKMFGPIFDKAMSDTGANFQKIDVDQSRDIASKYSIMSVPTLIFERDGVVINKKVGVLSYNELVSMINHS